MLWQPASVRLPAFELSALPVQFWLAGRYWPSLTANAAWPAKTATAENTMTRCRMIGSPSSRGGIRQTRSVSLRARSLWTHRTNMATANRLSANRLWVTQTSHDLHPGNRGQTETQSGYPRSPPHRQSGTLLRWEAQERRRKLKHVRNLDLPLGLG